MSPSPGALTMHSGRILKLLETRLLAGDSAGEPGIVTLARKGQVLVATRAGSLEIVRAQFEGKKALTAAELLNGRSLKEGDRLGG